MNKKVVIIPIVLVAGVATLVGWKLAHRGRALPAGAVRVSGNIEVTEVELSFRLPGWVAERPVDEGDSIKADQLVALLDTKELEQQAAAAKADAEAAAQLLAQLEAGSRPEEIAASEAALARAKADANAASAEFVRAQELLKKSVITQQEFDVRKAAHDSADAAVGQADANLRLVRAGPRKEEIAQARARAEAARAISEAAATRLAYARLVSPIQGVVLSKNTEPGEFVSAGTPIVTVGDIGNVYLRAYIPETDLSRVKLGQTVEVAVDTKADKVYKGTVSFISAQAEFTPKNIQTQQERVKLVYRVKIDIPNPERELKPGMPADADILTGQGN